MIKDAQNLNLQTETHLLAVPNQLVDMYQWVNEPEFTKCFCHTSKADWMGTQAKRRPPLSKGFVVASRSMAFKFSVPGNLKDSLERYPGFLNEKNPEIAKTIPSLKKSCPPVILFGVLNIPQTGQVVAPHKLAVHHRTYSWFLPNTINPTVNAQV